MLPEQIVDSVSQDTQNIIKTTLEGKIDTLMQGLHQAGIDAVLVDRAPVFDKQTLLHALYQSCQLPAYFGFNWDALSDALTDDELHEGRSLVLVFQDFALLKVRNPKDCDIFLDIMEEVLAFPHCLVKKLVLLET